MKRIVNTVLVVISLSLYGPFCHAQAGRTVFNVRDYGATGKKAGNMTGIIQKTIDACAEAGGGMVYLPPGEYSSGTLHLKSYVRLHLEAGATLYSIKVKEAFDRDALIYAEDAHHISLEGRGIIDGQGQYEWRPDDIEDDFIGPNEDLMVKLGKPILRAFPKKDQFGKLVLLLRCKDVLIRDLSFLDSPSWTIHPYACERLTIEGVYIRSSLQAGVWADGIDPDGCKDVRISNCTIETGDDALVFYSMNWFGPALPCENITVTNCRFTSSSSAIKFCDGNMNAIRNVTISNCVITNSNRGIAFMNFDGGVVSDVIISDVTIDCTRRDWFWWGDGDPLHFNIKRRSEVHKSIKPEDDRNPAGKIQRVVLRNIIARGKGSSVCNGHPDQWLEDVTLDNFKLYVSKDPEAPYDKAVHALSFKQARNLRLRNVEVFWEGKPHDGWQSALSLDEIDGLEITGFSGAPATPSAACIQMHDVRNATVVASSAKAATNAYILVSGPKSSNILLQGNFLSNARRSFQRGEGVPPAAVTENR